MAKRQLISGNKLERGIHSLLQNYAVLYAFLLVTERIFLLKILEDSGMGYLALPMDIFLIALFGIAFPLFKTSPNTWIRLTGSFSISKSGFCIFDKINRSPTKRSLKRFQVL